MTLEEYVLWLEAIVLTPLAIVLGLGAIAAALIGVVLLLGSRWTAWFAWPLLVAGLSWLGMYLASLVA